MFKTLASILTLSLVALAGFTAPAQAQGQFVVEYRLSAQRSAHFDEPRDAEQFSQGLKRLGCDVRMENHGDHLDVTYRCPQWRSLEVSSDEAAHRWEGWLRKQGFETSHQH